MKANSRQLLKKFKQNYFHINNETLNSYITESNEVRMHMGPWPERIGMVDGLQLIQKQLQNIANIKSLK